MTEASGLCGECWALLVSPELDDPRARFNYTHPPTCAHCRTRPGLRVYDAIVRGVQMAANKKDVP